VSERVSILIRSSARPELADALAALAAQTYRNLDVVVVNVTGRPHPPLPDAAAGLAINFVDPGRQLPRPLAANAAIDAATGDYLCFLDDDDLFEPEHVERCLAVARAHPNTVPFVGAQISDEKGELQALWPALGFGRVELIEKIKMQTNAPFIPRRALDADLRFDPSLPIFEDWDFWIRLSQRMPFRPLPHLTAVCRLGAGTSGTGVGANFDLERTARDSRPFHAKWDGERQALLRELDAHVGAAKAAAAARDWATAEQHCWEAQRLRIWDPVVLDLLARIFDARRESQRAKQLAAAAERARFLTPPHLSHHTLTTLYGKLQRGNAYALAGEEELAEKEFMGALALHQGDQTACNGLANLRIAQGRLADAEECLRQGTLWGDRVYPTLLLKRGGLLEQLGRRDEARAIYAYLLQLAPRFAAARGRLQALDAIRAAAA
jgi:Flp pilus assembly protein TadD